MKKILAVSGGIDSVVLLDILKNDQDVIVAHFNHGTRPSAKDDQLFVEKLAKTYQKPFFTTTVNLGENISEAEARQARYDFLKTIAKKEQGIIYTAHHLDDLIESITINFIRGTGWRGLTPFNSPEVERPLLNPQILSSNKPFSKNDIYRYAAENHLNFRQDPTNNSDYYLRNRLRTPVANLDVEIKLKLYYLWQSQKAVRAEFETELKNYLKEDKNYSRSFFKELSNFDEFLSLEILRAICSENNYHLTRPQLFDFLGAIINYSPGKKFNLPNNRFVKIGKNIFSF